MEVFCFVIGVLFIYTSHPYLPLGILFFYGISLRARHSLCFILGMLLALAHQWLISPKGLPNAEVIPSALISGFIASIPDKSPHKTRFNFAIKTLNRKPAEGLVQLSWFNKAPMLHAGQAWQLRVKLKKPRNFQNPGSFDYVGSLWSKHITWVGYIHSKANRLLKYNTFKFKILALRERLGEQLKYLTKNTQTASIMTALTLNLTNGISQDHWELFRRTGTLHLFSISGEHIALIGGMVFFLVKCLWSRMVWLCLHCPAQFAGSVSGLLVAFLYSLLAGFEPPVQRALIGCFLYTLSCLGKQRFDAWQIWRYALVVVVCLDAHAVLMQGFYFSFIAVACLLITSKRWPLKGYKSAFSLQLACLIGLLPLSLYWYSYGSINGLIANAFAIPLMGFLIVPLALISLVFSYSSLVFIFLKPLSLLIALLFKGLIWIEHLAFINISLSLPKIEYVLSVMTALLLWIILPIKSLKGLSFFGFLLPFIPTQPFIHKGEALIDVLDVGQGLSVSIQTKHHVLLYDTGSQFFNGSDLGKMVVLPFYKTLNIKKIDAIVISHQDIDHRGGLQSIESGMEIGQLLVNDIGYFHRGHSCHTYPSWKWDGVSFRFFPIQSLFNKRNNSSCILQVKTLAGGFLLTGDIEAKAEDYLIKKYGPRLKSQWLLIPHHGSKTSSTYRFLLEVAPQNAIVSLGFDNRFHFPHSKTLANLKRLGVDVYRTDQCGMLEFLLTAKDDVKKPSCFGSFKSKQK